MAALISIVIAYLLGSISCAILISKMTNNPDPRTVGSQNAGATNVLRTAGKKEAAIVLVGDALKGLIAVMIGHVFNVHGLILGLVALAAVIGHIFPVFFNFKGGKGVATALGALFGLSIICGLLSVITWIAIAYFTGYSSLASMLAVFLSVVYVVLFSFPSYFIPMLCIALLILWKHKENIARLKNKTESKIHFK